MRQRAGNVLVVLLGLALFGCSKPSGIIETQVGEDQRRTFPGTDVELRLGAMTGELQIAIRDKIVAHGPTAIGTRLPVTIDDQACEVVIRNTYEESVTRVRPSMQRGPTDPKPQNRDLQSRTLRGLTVQLVSAAGPVPGSHASQRGSRPIPSLPWGLPALILGLMCGLWARPEGRDGKRMARSGMTAILALIAAGVCASAMLDGNYALTYGILFGAWAIAGIVGGRLSEPDGWHIGVSWTALAVAAPFVLALLMPAWGIGVPILALLLGGVLAAIAAVIAVSVKRAY